ncbi:O-antigen ligase family protein [Phascolarctobacterium sp.]
MAAAAEKYARLEKYVYWLLLFTIAVIPLQQEVTAALVAVTGVCGLAVAFLRRHVPRQPVLPRAVQLLLWLLLLLGYWSLHNSADEALSTYNFIYVVGQYTALVWLLLHYGSGPDRDGTSVLDWRQGQNWPRPLQILSVFLGMSLLVSGYGIVQHFTGVVPTEAWVDNDAFPELKTRVISTLVNPNILGGYLVLVISVATGLLSTSREKSWRLVLGVCVLAAGLCLLYTYSRGNWVALAAALVLFCLCFCRRALLPLLGVGMLGLWFAGGAVWHRLISIFGTEDTSVALRFAYLESTLFIIEEHPWGVGWYGYQFIYPEYDFYLNNPNVIMYHCHNLLLNITAELGWQGLIVFLLLWGCVIWKAVELARSGKREWLQGFGRGYLMAVAGILVGGLTDHVYFNMQMGLLFWLFAILIMVCSEFNKKLTET